MSSRTPALSAPTLSAALLAAVSVSLAVADIDAIDGLPTTPSGRVSISGSGFGEQTAASVIVVDGSPAFVTEWSDTAIVAYVPESTDVGTAVLEVRQDRTVVGSGTIDVEPRERDGRIAWRFEADADYTLHRPAVAADGTVYFDDVEGRLYALAPDGGLKWIFDLSFGVPGNGSKGPIAVTPDGVVVAAYSPLGLAKSLVAVNPDGTLRWTYTIEAASGWCAGPAVGPDGNIYVAMDLAQQFGTPYDVFSITPDGDLRWTSAMSPQVFEDAEFGTEIVFGPSEPGGPVDQLMFNADSSNLGGVQTGINFGVRLSDGAQQFATVVGGINSAFQQGQIQLASNPQTGAFYMTEFAPGWRLQAFAPDGSRTWSVAPGVLGSASEPAVAPDGTVLFGWDLGNVTAVTPSGGVEWTLDTTDYLDAPVPSPTEPSFLLVATPGVGQAHRIESRDLADASLLWEQTLTDLDGALITTNTLPGFTPDGARAYVTGETLFGGNDSFLLLAIDTGDPATPADLNGDGVVDLNDVLVLLAAWGGPGADIDGDGTTGLSDLLAVLAAWSG